MCVHPAGIFTGGNRLFLRCTTGERKADEMRRDTLTNCINIDESFNFLLRE